MAIPSGREYVAQEAYTGGNNQLWKVHYNGDGTYALSCPAKPNWYMDAGVDFDGGSISISYKNGDLPNDCRMWLIPTAKGNFRITSREIGQFRALTGGRYDSTSVEAYTYTTADDQQWVFEKSDFYGPTSGISSGATYYIRSTYSNKYLSNTAGSTMVNQHSMTPSSSEQKWKVTYTGNGLYTFYSLSTSAYLSVQSNSNSSGALLQTSSTAQKFKIVSTGDAYFIIPSYSNLVLDVRGPSTAENAPIQLFNNENVPQQKWCFETVSTGKYKRTEDEIVKLVEQNDHGWTAITLNYSYDEYCNTFKGNEIYPYRSLYVTAKSSRPDYDTPYSFIVSGIDHYNGDIKLKSFSMTSYSVFNPSDVWKYSAKENREFCSYNNTHSYKGSFLMSISGGILPCAERIYLNLAY